MAESKPDRDDDDLLFRGREEFDRCVEAEDHNRQTALADLKFVRLSEQWPEDIRKQRQIEGRPCLTINRLPTFIRQVVNDARQNKPAIRVHPVDSKADPEVAKVMDGLIRNIEYQSGADVAYDTAVESAISGGFGYFRIGMDFAYDDAFEMDITIERVPNAFAVYGDPNSTAADSSDWDVGFVVDRIPKATYERKYKGKATVDWSSDAWVKAGDTWLNEDGVLIAEWWSREHVDRPIVQLSDGRVIDKETVEIDPDLAVAIEAGAIQIVGKRVAKSCKVRQVIMSGADILEDNEWPGRYIPIVPVYGEEFNIEGKRYWRSLIHNAKDAQQMLNFWRTASTEMVALAPRVPFIGRKQAFDSDQAKWQTVNTRSHPYIEYDGPEAPQRQPMDMGVAAGALQEAMNASDDIKSITGLYDASLGARSNETSGRAIMARQREGDISTFHFIDNLSRAIRHAGRILIDLIPKVYTKPRIIRVLGEDGTQEEAAVNQPTPEMDENGQPKRNELGEAIIRMYDLTVGKYDLTVKSGPSFTTRREEAAMQMTELVRAFPQAAPYMADIMARNFDWPGADEIAERFEKMLPGAQQIPPQVQQMLQQGQQLIQQLQQENAELKSKAGIEAQKVQVSQFDADTKRMKVQGELGMDILQALTPPAQPQQIPPR